MSGSRIFQNPFSAKYVSDGTIKMFTYLVLLNDPLQHALLCIEEPENQLYPELLNAIELEEVYYLQKKDGFTEICAY